MALTYTRQLLSGSTSGKMIEVSNTASPGTTIHTCGATATNFFEEIYLYAVNGATADMPVVIEFGGTATSDAIRDTIPSRDGLRFMVPGMSLTATTSIVRAYSTGTATEVLRIGGWANRAT